MREKAVVDKVFTRPKKATMPTMLKFQNGALSMINKENTQFCRMLDTKEKMKAALVVAEAQVYHGVVDAEKPKELTDTYICVRNKITNKVRILPIEKALLNNNIYSELEKSRTVRLSAENRQKMLLKQFGGRKASRYIINQEKMQMNIDVVKNELDATVSEASFTEPNAEDQQESDAHLNSIRPKFNRNAKHLHEVYEINDVVPMELLERLNEEANVVFTTPVDKLPLTSEYLRKCLADVQAEATISAAGLLKIKLIIYMDCLLNLVKSRVRSLRNTELSGITEKVENDVRIRFSDPNQLYTRTAASAEKALCYFIVLALLIGENYKVSIASLTQDLNVPRQRILKYAHIINARVKPNSDILSLQLPENMPPLPTKFNRKSGKPKIAA